MKTIFVTNFMNHHQKPLWDEFIKYISDFRFIACSTLPEEQLNLGYHTYDEPYLIQYTLDNAATVEKMVLDAEVVIFGSKPQPLFKKRLMTNKKTIVFSERLFKKTGIDLLRPLKLIRLRKKYLINKNNIPNLLCAGAYVGKDYESFGYPKGKALKWGYFPEISLKSLDEIQKNKNEKFTILWTGRFINLKHPEIAIEIASYLKERNVDFQLKMIGKGEMLDRIKSMISQRGLEKFVVMTGSMSPEDVKAEMEKAHVFLMTSDRQEGWGAVVNEAMSCACTVVSTIYPGCVPYLIKNGVNGMIVDVNNFSNSAYELSQNMSLCNEMGSNAYHTIHDEWNYAVAAKRLAEFINSNTIYDDGPLSYNE